MATATAIIDYTPPAPIDSETRANYQSWVDAQRKRAENEAYFWASLERGARSIEVATGWVILPAVIDDTVKKPLHSETSLRTPPPKPITNFIRMPDLLKQMQCSRSHIYNMIADERRFPPPEHQGGRGAWWDMAKVEAWLQASAEAEAQGRQKCPRRKKM